jgi:protein-L-isoaspartate(D-aspartate) O-methyltransferase
MEYVMTEMNTDQARYNMVEQQIRPWDVLDERVLEVISKTPRERFAPDAYKKLAFADIEIPLGNGQRMMEPKLEGRILQELHIKPTDSILEIGTGSGYLAACLAQLGEKLVTVEIYNELSQQAQQQIAGLGLENVDFRSGDASKGWDEDGNFDVIVITGSLPEMNDNFSQRLNVGGRMFVVTGEEPVMEAMLVTRVSEHEWKTENLFETSLPALVNARQPQHFTF